MKCYIGTILSVDANDGVYKFLVEDNGYILVGKVADMVIISDNPYTVETERLADIKVEELILSGKAYESAVAPLGKCIWQGLISQNRY